MGIFIILSLSRLNRSSSKRKNTLKLFLRNDTVEKGEFVKSCDIETVYCIDDCSFLCLNGENYQCVGNVCVLNSSPRYDKDDCQMGIKVLMAGAKIDVPQWQCLCINPTIFIGSHCDRTAIDVCEQGIFLFGESETYNCICNPPYELMWDKDNKPHCLERHWRRFFKN